MIAEYRIFLFIPNEIQLAKAFEKFRYLQKAVNDFTKVS